jgi:CHRD domain
MSRRLAALLGVVCLFVLGLGGAIAVGHGGDDDGHAKSRALFADLNGFNELDSMMRRGAGDLDGFGSASVTFDGGQVCFGITVANIDTPTAAHIHRGGKSVNGPVVVPLVHPTAGDPGASSGCTPVDPALAEEIQDHPRGFYVNVHTATFPDGAVRGQLTRLRDDNHDDD